MVYVLAACGAVASGNVGFDLGINADSGPFVQRDLGISNMQLELSLGLEQVSAIIGALAVCAISDRLGRLRGFIAAPVLCIAGRTCLLAANSFPELLFGRVLVGIGVGANLTIAPLYVTEIAPADCRGFLGAWPEIANCVFMLIAFVVGSCLRSLPDGQAWRLMSSTGLILPVLMIFLVKAVMLESPRWLLRQRRCEEATQVLVHLYPRGTDIDAVVSDISESITAEQTANVSVGWNALIGSPGRRHMLALGLAIACSQQMVAMDAITFYFPFIMRAAGLESLGGQLRTGMLFGTVKLCCTLLSGTFLDRYGRRPIMMVSLGGIGLMFLLLACNFALSGPPLMAQFALMGYVAFYSMGAGPGSWLIPCEIFSNAMRAKAMSLASLLNRGSGALVTSVFLSLPTMVGWSATFMLGVAVAFMYVALIYFCLPETKGKTLEEISAAFGQADEEEGLDSDAAAEGLIKMQGM